RSASSKKAFSFCCFASSPSSTSSISIRLALRRRCFAKDLSGRTLHPMRSLQHRSHRSFSRRHFLLNAGRLVQISWTVFPSATVVLGLIFRAIVLTSFCLDLTHKRVRRHKLTCRGETFSRLRKECLAAPKE